MKTIVLTSETQHHAYFVRELTRVFPLECVFVERNVVAAPFETHHPFEDTRESYERETFFHGKEACLSNFAETIEVNSINEPKSLDHITKIAPDVIIVFGTGKVSKKLIRVCPDTILNLHGGDPEEYRGLDSHLWTIYHHDFDRLVTTLHHLTEEFDTGDIILQTAVPLKTGMELHELRSHNTEACLQITISALEMITRWGHTLRRPQRKRGRYYSFMPSSLKEICQARFRRYMERLS